jgi:hypothetical protein
VIGKTKFEKLNFNVTEFYLEVSADTEKSFSKGNFENCGFSSLDG